MLIFFKPWVTAFDLHDKEEKWSHTFDVFFGSTSVWKSHLDNMQILHECRDSRDNHFERRRRGMGFNVDTFGTGSKEVNDDFVGDTDPQSNILQHLELIQDNRSKQVHRRMLAVSEVLDSLRDVEMFDGSIRTGFKNVLSSDAYSEVPLDYPAYEEHTWEKVYEEWRTQWRRRNQNHEPDSMPDHDPSPGDHEHLDSQFDNGDHLHDALKRDSSPVPCMEPGYQHDISPEAPDADVNVDEVIALFTLNKEQAQAFHIIAEHSLQKQPTQLKMFLSGAGGTGKSRVIHALKHFFFSRNQERRFHLASFTGVAAKNICGATLHSLLMLGQRMSKNGHKKMSPELVGMWQGVEYLFIDEVSMIGCKLLYNVCEALQSAKENDRPFGGINIIFAGDFTQLPLVGQVRLYAHLNTKSMGMLHQMNMIGKVLWYSIDTVVILREVMRQAGSSNCEFVSMLS